MKYLLLFILLPINLMAQDTLHVGHRFSQMKNLELGVTKDIIYTELNGKVNSVTLKTRKIEKLKVNGKSYLSFRHEWNSGNPDFNGWFDYLCDAETLKPVQHVRMVKKIGKEAFAFTDSKITGLDSAINNTKSDFSLELETPTFNWEIDLETYSLLPMKANYHAVMNFYHPGAGKPKYYHLKVIGSEKVALPNGKSMDCWIVFTDYGGSQPTRFWYTKKGQNFVKMEGKYNQLTIRKERIF